MNISLDSYNTNVRSQSGFSTNMFATSSYSNLFGEDYSKRLNKYTAELPNILGNSTTPNLNLDTDFMSQNIFAGGFAMGGAGCVDGSAAFSSFLSAIQSVGTEPAPKPIRQNMYSADYLKSRSRENVENYAYAPSKGSGKDTTIPSNYAEMLGDIPNAINCEAKDLAGVIDIESNWKPEAKNGATNASGIGQLMPNRLKQVCTRLGKNVTPEQFRSMSIQEQMPFLKEYLLIAKNEAGFSENYKLDAGELYALFAGPANAQKSYIYKKGSAAYNGNYRIWDLNKDGFITTADLGQVVDQRTSKLPS